jgi:hypothetical protein
MSKRTSSAVRAARSVALLLALLAAPGACGEQPPRGSQAAQIAGNALCPVSDKPVAGSPSAPTFFADHRGYRIGFMCPHCLATFRSAPEPEKDRLLAKARRR